VMRPAHWAVLRLSVLLQKTQSVSQAASGWV
jgi:hypothetical protein